MAMRQEPFSALNFNKFKKIDINKTFVIFPT